MKSRQIFTVALISTLVSSLFLPTSNASNTLDQKPAALPPVVVVTSTTSGAAFGGEGGGPFETACPTNHVVTGVYVSNDYSSYEYNYAFALRCTLVKLAADNSMVLEGTGTKKVVFEFGVNRADQPSLCSSGMGLTRLTGYHFSYGEWVTDLASTCRTFDSQTNSESISSAIGWDQFATSRVTSCEPGSFVIGVYGRNGEGIDKVGVRCGAFSVDYPKVAPFESAFPMDLIPTSASSLSTMLDVATCSIGTFGYQFVGMSAKDAQKVELDSVTLLLKVDGVLVGSASSDSYKNLPKWLIGIDNSVQDAVFSKGSATWKLSSVSNSARITCQILAYKEHQMTYITIK